MSIVNFPDIKLPIYPIDEDWEDIALRAGFENGPEVSRPRMTRSRGTWVLRWTSLPTSDYLILMDFYKNIVKGSSQRFYWTNPLTNITYLVRIIAKSPFQSPEYNKWSGELTLREG